MCFFCLCAISTSKIKFVDVPGVIQIHGRPPGHLPLSLELFPPTTTSTSTPILALSLPLLLFPQFRLAWTRSVLTLKLGLIVQLWMLPDFW